MTKVVFLPEAEMEMLEAAKFYESQASGLGVDYISEVEHAVRAIAESPTTWPIIEGELRRRLVRSSFWNPIPYRTRCNYHYRRISFTPQTRLLEKENEVIEILLQTAKNLTK